MMINHDVRILDSENISPKAAVMLEHIFYISRKELADDLPLINNWAKYFVQTAPNARNLPKCVNVSDQFEKNNIMHGTPLFLGSVGFCYF